MRPRTIKNYVDEELQFAEDVEKVFAGDLSDEASHEIIVRLTAAKQAAEGYRENDINAFLAKVYYCVGSRFANAGDMQSALDNFLQAQAVLPEAINNDGKIVKTIEEMEQIQVSIRACLDILHEDNLEAFTDKPPQNELKPVARPHRPEAALPPESTLKNAGGFAKSPNSAFHSPREEPSDPEGQGKERKKPGLGS
jgi:hypothetical protein